MWCGPLFQQNHSFKNKDHHFGYKCRRLSNWICSARSKSNLSLNCYQPVICIVIYILTTCRLKDSVQVFGFVASFSFLSLQGTMPSTLIILEPELILMFLDLKSWSSSGCSQGKVWHCYGCWLCVHSTLRSTHGLYSTLFLKDTLLKEVCFLSSALTREPRNLPNYDLICDGRSEW